MNVDFPKHVDYIEFNLPCIFLPIFGVVEFLVLFIIWNVVC